MNILKDLRAQTGRKQADVASEAGISREYLSALENGRQRLVRDLAEKLAAIYGVSPADLMGYRLSEDTRILKDERDIYRSRLEAREREFARILQEKQAEIDATQAEIMARAVRGDRIPDIRTMRPKTPRYVVELLQRMCDPKPERRFSTPIEIVQFLDNWLKNKLDS